MHELPARLVQDGLAECGTFSGSPAFGPRPGGAVLGRSRDCDIVLSDANVSRHHAEIRPAGDGWTIADLGSTNGVVVNGRNARGAVALSAGDQVELGTSKLRFELE